MAPRVLRPYVTGKSRCQCTGTPCLARIRRRWRLGYGASVDHRMARGSRGRRITALRPTTYCLRYTGGNVVI